MSNKEEIAQFVYLCVVAFLCLWIIIYLIITSVDEWSNQPSLTSVHTSCILLQNDATEGEPLPSDVMQKCKAIAEEQRNEARHNLLNSVRNY